jgi:hypothetical protein
MIEIETERATIHYQAYRHIDVRMNDGARQRLLLSDKPHAHMLATFQRCLRDPAAGKLGATLEMSRAHVVAVNVASEAAPVIEVPSEHVQPIHDSEDNVVRSIDGIVAALKASVERKCMLHETGMLPWAHRAYAKDVGNYSHFRGPYSARSVAGRSATAIDPVVAVQSKLPLRPAGAINS